MRSSTAEVELNEDERAGLELIRESGGIHQSDFWKELEFSSRKGSRIVESLVEKELVDREETVYEGHNTTTSEDDFDAWLISSIIGDESADQ